MESNKYFEASSLSYIPVVCQETIISFPSLDRIGFTYEWDVIPQESLDALFISFNISFGKNILNQSFPTTSAFVYPVVLSALLLKILILWSLSSPTIMALAVSTILSEKFFSFLSSCSPVINCWFAALSCCSLAASCCYHLFFGFFALGDVSPHHMKILVFLSFY